MKFDRFACTWGEVFSETVLRFLLIFLVAAATLTFFLGITQPLMVFEKLFFWEEQASLVEIVQQLWLDQSWPLALVVGGFSILLPLIKLVYLGTASLAPALLTSAPWMSFLSHLSKWSMMDVLIVAIIIVATKTSGLAKATAQPGLWYFMVSVILMAVATVLVQREKRMREAAIQSPDDAGLPSA
ncbi:MAG: paraquat-inducible protein A [Pseudomonadota bacterium]